MFGVRVKYLYPKQEFVFRMIREILLTSCLEDEKRLQEILSSVRGRLQSAIPAAGHQSASARALSYQSPAYEWQERTTGISYFRLVEDLEAHFREKKEQVIRDLRLLIEISFPAGESYGEHYRGEGRNGRTGGCRPGTAEGTLREELEERRNGIPAGAEK